MPPLYAAGQAPISATVLVTWLVRGERGNFPSQGDAYADQKQRAVAIKVSYLLREMQSALWKITRCQNGLSQERGTTLDFVLETGTRGALWAVHVGLEPKKYQKTGSESMPVPTHTEMRAWLVSGPWPQSMVAHLL